MNLKPVYYIFIGYGPAGFSCAFRRSVLRSEEKEEEEEKKKKKEEEEEEVIGVCRGEALSPCNRNINA